MTSILSVSTDPYPLAPKQSPNGTYEGSGDAEPQNNIVENGASVEDRDEIMTEVPQAEVGEDMTIDMETIEEIVRSSEANPTPAVDS